jgi:glycosyltransferase involved in cell wall biosynthesis
MVQKKISKQPTILFPIGSFYPAQSGGPNNTIYWITRSLKNNGLHPIIITTDDGIKPEHNINLNQWKDSYYGNVIYNKTLMHYFPYRAFINSWKHLKEAEVVHLTAIFYPLSWMIAITNTIFFKKKIIWSLRGELDDNALVYSAWKKKPILLFIRLFLKNKVTFHSTCDVETQDIKNNFGNEVSIIQIPNYLELPNLVSVKKEKYLLYLGRIHPIKAIENLIEAINLSQNFKNQEFKLKIAGNYNNPYGKELIALIKKLKLENKVEFVGHIEGNKKQELLAKAYYLVMPSHTENFGNVVVEALAQKTPVIASKGTPWNILETRKAGYWVDNDVQSLVKIIDNVLSQDRKSYDDMSVNALKLAKEEFDIERNIYEWINSYQQIANGTK